MANKARSINLSESIRAPKDKVFSMLVKGNDLIRWFPTTAETDPVVGGHYMFTFEFLDPATAAKANHTRSGEFTEVVPNEKAAYTWNIGGDTAIGETEVSFALSEKNGVTTLNLEHSGWGDDKAADNAIEEHSKGWTFFLQNLKAVLEQGMDSRSKGMGMKEGVQQTASA